MRYLIIVSLFFVLSCDNETVKIDNAIEECATSYYLKHRSSYWRSVEEKNIEKLLENSRIYQDKFKAIYSIIPSAFTVDMSERYASKIEIAHLHYMNIYGVSKITKKEAQRPNAKLFSDFFKFRSDLLKEKISKMNLKEKKNLKGFVKVFERCENKRSKNPRTFMLKFGN